MEFKVLGPLEVLSDGQPLQLGPPQQRALLALLLLNANQVVATDRLAEELWPAEVPKTASKAIQVYVSSLRKAFGTSRDALETRGNGYVLHVEAGELDLHEFELLLERAKAEEPGARVATLHSALSLWRGAPLADLTYEPFAQPEAARLEALRLLAQEERIEAELALGRGPDLVPELDALVAESPLQERPRAQLMLALYRSGRQADALDVFREGRRILDEELGLEPGPALRELESAILRQDPELVAPATAPAPSIIALSEHREAREAVVSLAAALALRPRNRDVVVAEIVPPADLGDSTERLGELRRVLAERGVTIRVAAFTSADPAADVIRLGMQQDADLLIVQHTTGVVAQPRLGAPGVEGLRAQAAGAGLLVVGLSERWRSEGLGSMRASLVETPVTATLLVRRGLRPSGIAPAATLTRFTWSIERQTMRS